MNECVRVKKATRDSWMWMPLYSWAPQLTIPRQNALHLTIFAVQDESIKEQVRIIITMRKDKLNLLLCVSPSMRT